MISYINIFYSAYTFFIDFLGSNITAIALKCEAKTGNYAANPIKLQEMVVNTVGIQGAETTLAWLRSGF